MASFTVDNQKKNFHTLCVDIWKKPEKTTYEYDLGGYGTGVLTGTPQWTVPPEGLDAFGKITHEVVEERHP